MRHSHRLLAASLVLLSACATTATPGPRSEVLVVDENGGVIRHNVDENTRVTIEATPDRIWQALLATYAELGIQPTLSDKARWRYGNQGFIMPSEFHRRPRAEYLSCSSSQAGIAGTARVIAQVTSQLVPASATSTTIVTSVSAQLRTNEGTSTANAPIACLSNGVLEEYIRKEIERRLMTIP